MRVIIIFALFVTNFLSVNAQAKKYIFLDHFTNSVCSNCASFNPGFFTLLKKYEGNYNHVTVHPRYPYSSCQLYQANRTENDLRAAVYSVTSTPTLVINGTKKMALGNVNASTLDAELNKVSPIEIEVKETGTTTRLINVEVKTLGNKPSGNYRIYAIAVEKLLNYASPNGEKVHHNVFRKFLSSQNGDLINLPETGNSMNLNFTMNVESSWKESEMYALVWIQESTTREVLNSGNKFNSSPSSTNQVKPIEFKVLSNPVRNDLTVQLDKSYSGDYAILNIMGQVIHRGQLNSFSNMLELDVADFKKGIYLIRIQSGAQKLTKRWVKE